MADQIRYDLLTQQALRGVMRDVLADAAKKGLPGEHHFYISFDTRADGVKLSDRLRAQYPEEMTVILQHQFWDLTVNDEGFEVGLSFGGVPEKLQVPFDAINGFFDPSVQFGLQFEEVTEQAATPPLQTKSGEQKPRRGKSTPAPAPQAMKVPANPETPPLPPEKSPARPKREGGGEVVRLDRFRKK
jgi:hypothetical protein